MSLTNETNEYLSGHVIDGETLVPPVAYLTMVWENVGILHPELYTETYTEISVIFEDVNFIRPVCIPKDGEVQLTVMVQKGNFNVSKYTKCY